MSLEDTGKQRAGKPLLKFKKYRDAWFTETIRKDLTLCRPNYLGASLLSCLPSATAHVFVHSYGWRNMASLLLCKVHMSAPY